MQKFFAVVDHTGLEHFTKKVVAFTGTLSNPGKHGQTVVALGNVVDQFHDQNGLTYTGTTKESNFTTTSIWLEKVDHFDTGF